MLERWRERSLSKFQITRIFVALTIATKSAMSQEVWLQSLYQVRSIHALQRLVTWYVGWPSTPAKWFKLCRNNIVTNWNFMQRVLILRTWLFCTHWMKPRTLWRRKPLSTQRTSHLIWRVRIRLCPWLGIQLKAGLECLIPPWTSTE